MKKRTTWIVVGAVLLMLGVLLYPWRKPSQPILPTARAQQSQPTQNNSTPSKTPDDLIAPVGVKGDSTTLEQERENYLEAMTRKLMKPIEFYGSVIDHEGRPVADAKVAYRANNNPDPTGSGSYGETSTDVGGMFIIKTSGASIYVEVSKAGYYRAEEVNGQRGSYGVFKNHDKLGNTDAPIPSKPSPAVFVLRKIGAVESLVATGRKTIRVPKDGTPTDIALTTGQEVPIGKGDIRIEAWTDDSTVNIKGRYDWRCRVSVPNGGLAERSGQFDFEAPESGYTLTVEFGQSATAERWRPNIAKEFFVRLANNCFARINFEMIAGGDHFIVLESFLNPKPGNRNLEFDPARNLFPSLPSKEKEPSK